MNEITNIDISFNGTITVTYKENDITRFISVSNQELLAILKNYTDCPVVEK